MDLGAFSVSLRVDDLDASRAFYETLGFQVTGGVAEEGWLILVNGTTIIGLFHGHVEENVLTFNPGLDNHMAEVEDFTDVREIQRRLQEAGVPIELGVDPDHPEGPGHMMVRDPDGNAILIDQFR
jgi:catechol 2,3-dioxygenase-like lactoylglutathione lyase family enzyme